MPNIIETRLIYTAGTYKFSTAIRNCRRVLILVDLLRAPPFQIYANEKSNPPVYFLGYWTLWIGDYVYDKKPLEFTEQCIIHYGNPELQLLNNILAVGTQLGSIIQSLGAAMSPPAPVILYPSFDSEAEACPYTWIKFKLPEGTRIQLTAVGTPLQEFAGAQALPGASDPQDDVPRYPVARPRSEDPARSAPNAGEKLGDTAPATLQDPDISYVPPICTLTVGVLRSDTGATEYVSNTVPDGSYRVAYREVTGPGTIYLIKCNGSQGVVTVAGPFNPGDIGVTIVSSINTCPAP